MKKDPPRRADGLCACGCKKKVKVNAKYCGREVAEAEPFATANCVRRWYGLRLPEDDNQQGVQGPSRTNFGIASFSHWGKPDPTTQTMKDSAQKDLAARRRLGIAA